MINYGDASPFVHDGMWIEKLENGDYEVIELRCNFEEGFYEVDCMVVDITASWINHGDVLKTCDSSDSGERYAQNLIWYYGESNFGSDYSHNFKMKGELTKLKNFLKVRGIKNKDLR